jgi:ATP-binding cassette subfamily B protein
MKLPPGKIVALVGENGSGKTTLIKLLCRLYDPMEGAITIDDIDLRGLRTFDLRSKISIIFQDYAHYAVTARENIWFGNIDLPIKDDKVLCASKYSGASKVINGLENGYDTYLGTFFDDGHELSSGEWQKIALARIFMRDSQIIILDEPTSSIDPLAEYKIFKYIREMAIDRCIILISHKLSAIKMADYIYVIKDGKILEDGIHEELMKNKWIYANMFSSNSQDGKIFNNC